MKSITSAIEKKIEIWPDKKVFRLEDFPAYKKHPKAVSQALSRLVQKEVIVRIDKGRFYKPKASRFGVVRPNENAILESFLYQGKKIVAYLTGTSLYYLWGLTTQIPAEVQLKSAESSLNRNIGSIRIRAKKAPVRQLNASSVKILQLLDILDGLRTIPDADSKQVLLKIENVISQFDDKDIKASERLAMSYRASVKAMLGSLLEEFRNYESTRLKKELSPFSKYQAGISAESLVYARKWQLS